jgi:hypothetical protein
MIVSKRNLNNLKNEGFNIMMINAISRTIASPVSHSLNAARGTAKGFGRIASRTYHSNPNHDTDGLTLLFATAVGGVYGTYKGITSSKSIFERTANGVFCGAIGAGVGIAIVEYFPFVVGVGVLATGAYFFEECQSKKINDGEKTTNSIQEPVREELKGELQQSKSEKSN